uniref:Protein HflC n=1 Tax=uncultured Thiotrichaceae bacterium TaxID=298394 RepID=A0A6S6UHU9_9GAMM|nr:MAG: HflC protein [uncultured Thiotrichaceae bacterium]
MDIKRNLIAGALLLLAVFIYASAYTVDEREKAIKFQFSRIVDSEIEPGLHFKLPLMQSVTKFPARILTLDANEERFLTSEKKYVLVDFFVKWKISDVATFFRATSGRLEAASSRLEDIMKDGLRNEFSRRTIEQALSEQRDEIMQGLENKSNAASQQLGISIVDVRVSKIDFPEQVSESVFERMRSERKRVAQDFRARGAEEAEKIKAGADRQATIIMAEAYRDSEKTRGEGDAKSAATYASAYQEDSDFYSFYRSLDAYRKTLGKQGDMMVLEPDSEFFRFFGNKSPKTSLGTGSLRTKKPQKDVAAQ